jgi:O-antigen/teichoic acid export membrane protein
MHRVWKFAGGIMLIGVVAGLNTQLDRIVISKYLPIDILGCYTLAVSVSQGLIFLTSPVTIALQPRFTTLISEKKNNGVDSLFKSLFYFVSIIVLTVGVNILFNAEKVLWVWTGNKELAIEGAKYLFILILGSIALAYQVIPYCIALANGYTLLNNYIGIASLLITIPGYIYATQYFGAIGAAGVYAFVQLLISPLYIFGIKRKFLKEIKFKNLCIFSFLIPMVICSFIFFLFSLLPINASSRLFELIKLIITTCAAFCLLYLLRKIFIKV